jgi:hypothetical protein
MRCQFLGDVVPLFGKLFKDIAQNFEEMAV